MSVLELQLESKTWTNRSKLLPEDSVPCCRWGHASCLIPSRPVPDGPRPVEQFVWLAGGFNSHCNLNDVWRFCPTDGRFARVASEVSSLPYRAAYHSMVCDDVAKRLLAFGGQCCVGGPYQFFDRVLSQSWLNGCFCFTVVVIRGLEVGLVTEAWSCTSYAAPRPVGRHEIVMCEGTESALLSNAHTGSGKHSP